MWVPLTRTMPPIPPPSAWEYPWLETSWRRLWLAPVFGLGFGFLLQKGGVAKFDILVGALLLENFVVIQVMLSAILVGTIGVYLLQRRGQIELQVKETNYGANIAGGLLFGVGFGLLAYCPGTDAAAVGQGNKDALVGILGMICGSYLYALGSNRIEEMTRHWGARGKLTLPMLVNRPRGMLVAVIAPALLLILLMLELVSRR